jgi:Lhr-like helicase
MRPNHGLVSFEHSRDLFSTVTEMHFKKGTYNTIVATSIGEEGLDIGEVDLIVCYDSSAQSLSRLIGPQKHEAESWARIF